MTRGRGRARPTHTRSVAWSIPANLPDAWWIDPIGAPETLTYATQPTLTNANFEGGTTGWSRDASILSLESVNPYAGVYSGILTRTAPQGSIYQAALIAYNRYALSGVARSADGTTAPAIELTGGVRYWLGTTSTNWQTIAGEGTPTNTLFLAATDRAGTFGSVQFDNLGVTNLSLAAVSPRQGTGELSNATGTSQPWVDSEGWMRFDRVSGDSLLLDTKFNALHSTEGAVSYFAAVYPSALVSTDAVIIGNVGVATHTGLDLAFSRLNQCLVLYIANATGAYEIFSGAPGSTARSAKHLIEYHRNGTSISLVCDGTEVASGTATKLTTTVASSNTCIGNTSQTNLTNGWDGALGAHLLVARATPLSESEKLKARQILAASHGITLA